MVPDLERGAQSHVAPDASVRKSEEHQLRTKRRVPANEVGVQGVYWIRSGSMMSMPSALSAGS